MGRLAADWPELKIEIGFGSGPNDELSSISWSDVTDYVRSMDITRGRSHELEAIQAGTAVVVLDNRSRVFEPEYSGSPYYPNILPLTPIRISADWDSGFQDIFTGFVEDWPVSWEGKSESYVSLPCVDYFEPLNTALISSAYATLTTNLTGTNNDLTFTAANPGPAGNDIQIKYVSTGSLSASVSGSTLTVNINSGVTTAGQVKGLLEVDSTVTQLVTVELAAGNSGTGTVTAFGPTVLAGGTMASELSGSRVNTVLDAVNYPTADRDVSDGAGTIADTVLRSASALSHLIDVAQTELGVFYISKSGNVTFKGREVLNLPAYNTSVATYGDAMGEAPYTDLTFALSKNEIRNCIHISPVDGSEQVSGDSASIDRYGLRCYQINTLVGSETEASTMADWLLVFYKDPHTRVSQFTVRPRMKPDLMWPLVLAHDIGDMVTIKRTPPGGSGRISNNWYIQGLRHSITQEQGSFRWETTFATGVTLTSAGLAWFLGEGLLGVDTYLAF